MQETRFVNKFGRAGIAALFATSLLFSGCQASKSMRMHVAVADVDCPNPQLKFYRININAKSSNSKATLQTGYFDANAVRQLFGEVKKENAGPNAVRSGSHAFVFESGGWRKVPDNELFTIMYGADADSLVEQINLTASSLETGTLLGQTVAKAVGGTGLQEAETAEKTAAEQLTKLLKAVDEIKAATKIENLADDAAAADAGKALLKAIQSALEALGSTQKINTENVAKGFADAEAALKALLTSSQP